MKPGNDLFMIGGTIGLDESLGFWNGLIFKYSEAFFAVVLVEGESSAINHGRAPFLVASEYTHKYVRFDLR